MKHNIIITIDDEQYKLVKENMNCNECVLREFCDSCDTYLCCTLGGIGFVKLEIER